MTEPEMKKNIFNISIIAVLMVTVFLFQYRYLDFLSLTDRIAIFYLPAAVITIGSLLFGYYASIGIFLGCAFLNFYLSPELHFASNLALSVIPGLTSALTLLFTTLTNRHIKGFLAPKVRYSDIDAIDILYFCIVHAVINTFSHQALFKLIPELSSPEDLGLAFSMLLGDLTGSFLVFVMLNLLFSAFKPFIFRLVRAHNRAKSPIDEEGRF